MSYFALDVLVEANSLCINSDSRRGVCAFDVGGVVVMVVELRENRKKSEHETPSVKFLTTVITLIITTIYCYWC